jgi:hypothetical protein
MPLQFPDKEAQFTESLKASGGTAVYMQPGDDLEQIIRECFPEAKRIASNLPDMKCATYNPDDVADPRELNNTDLAIIKGEFAVAENGAVWIPKTVKYKGLYFISSNLVILVKKGERSLIICMKPIANWRARITISVSLYQALLKRLISSRHWYSEHMDRLVSSLSSCLDKIDFCLRTAGFRLNHV